MNGAQLHLALNHLPLTTFLLAGLFLALSFIRRFAPFRITGLLLLVLGGLFAVPAFLTGEPAEEIVEDKPGVTHELVHDHEEAGEAALIVAIVIGLVGAAGLATHARKHKHADKVAVLCLIFALVGLASMARTSHLGGMIRHDEIR